MRPPYRATGKRGTNPVVLGRKFCPSCGRWRLLVDFHVNGRWPNGEPRHWQGSCATCQRIHKREVNGHQPRPPALTHEERLARARERWRQRREDPVWLADRREYERIYKEAKRREAGIKPTTHRRRTVVDRREYVFLDPGPLLGAIKGWEDLDLEKVTGIPARTIYRYRVGESRHVRLDLADRLALAVGTHLYDLYGDAPLIHIHDAEMAA